MIKFFELISTGFYIGKIKKFGPTISTAFAIPIVFLPYKIFVFFALLAISIISCYIMVNKTKQSDPQEVVIDEILAYTLIFLFLEINLKNLTVSFIVFRILDALKPFPSKILEHIKYIGIILDDIVASIYTIILLKLWNF
ncbi:MAG: phosphatidylglycerophosphatase A [candidate division WOR-3 bacterium]|nr:phosphatidylglycerophosphatase A [candidate division WOR-3 bacterium]MCX7947529.1 phosphatidylglycerophosphatase A [candidate division WOR-3 bacterium]MDW8150415.1 phosphatidylglycerophosphatase A [candidate division WOR-3 bacterium]